MFPFSLFLLLLFIYLSIIPPYVIPHILFIFLLLSRFSRVQLLATPWTAAHQAPLSMGFSRQEYWSWVPLPSPIYFSNSTLKDYINVCPQWLALRKFASLHPFENNLFFQSEGCS